MGKSCVTYLLTYCSFHFYALYINYIRCSVAAMSRAFEVGGRKQSKLSLLDDAHFADAKSSRFERDVRSEVMLENVRVLRTHGTDAIKLTPTWASFGALEPEYKPMGSIFLIFR